MGANRSKNWWVCPFATRMAAIACAQFEGAGAQEVDNVGTVAKLVTSAAVDALEAVGEAGATLPVAVTPRTVVPAAARLALHEHAAAFRLAAASAAAVDATSEEGQAAAREAGRRLVALAAGGGAELLGELLRPDPAVAADHFTVACYQIGDIGPTTLRDFPDPVGAVGLLARCDDSSHVAAELVVSNDDGMRWTAAVRTGDDVRFQLPANAATVEHDAHRDAAARWDDRLVAWAIDPEQSPTALEPVATVPAQTIDLRPEPAAAPVPVTVQVAAAPPDPRVDELLARIGRLEAQLASDAAGGRWEQMGRQVDAMLAIWRRTRRPPGADVRATPATSS